ncbi:DNA repair protein RecO [Methylocella tundrae]|uniref:DNA repair protein RecO n=1 Tax=Methylocella tundrae TaxID=227605 RepID=A0A8B6M637_METTU|nr:DNA repair protein RecO [Methylocella tundrae]VTZ28064.1 DNA repair protein RecO [Methylocella tundrae]VTZ49780.1 DNA repair protein RecO [Methylocella tundrae]
MEWRDESLIIGLKKYGETSVIVEAMTRAHGRHLGLVKGGRSRKMQAFLQPGNSADLVWRARLDEHLGFFAVEPTRLRTARLMASAEALHAIGLIGALLRLLAERDPHPDLYDAATFIADHIDDDELPALIVRLEVDILTETGFGLDLSRCAATGDTRDLVYVSPKSGRAVSSGAGEPYRGRLLPLPPFLRQGGDPYEESSPSPGDIRDGFRLTEFFLIRDVFGPRGLGLPEARSAYLAELAKRADWGQ